MCKKMVEVTERERLWKEGNTVEEREGEWEADT